MTEHMIKSLPDGFEYPREFLRVLSLEHFSLEPWLFPDASIVEPHYAGLRERYPDRSLVPFSVRRDNDDVACWDLDSGGISIIHDYATSGWEQRERFDSFRDWMKKAVDDFLDW
jgi:hypothetical protein